MNYTCPAGLDCSSSNSCPSLLLPCPTGWFCSSITGRPDRESLIKAFSLLDSKVTVPAGDFYQQQCPIGYYCPTSSQLLACPAGSWCSEGLVAPIPCDSLSYCPAGAGFQVNFAAALLALLYTLLVVGASWMLRARQQRAAAACRALQAQGSSPTRSPSTSSLSSSSAKEDSLPVAEEPPPAAAASSGLSFTLRSLALQAASAPSRSSQRQAGSVLSSSAPPRTLLSGSLHVPSGGLAAILGPSGCGKTLLLQTLRRGGGSAPPGTAFAAAEAGSTSPCTLTQGSSATPVSPASLRSSDIGYVPQEDTLDRAFTARELLEHSAALRLPAGTPALQRSALVAATLAELGLSGVADVVVGGGGGAQPNISGGQLKRVSIGIELVAQPTTLFLDEPTRGLDATSALALLQCLRSIVKARGVTIVAALAQPRAEALLCVDTLLLLSSEGRVCYAGPSAGAVEFVKDCAAAAAAAAITAPAAVVALPKGFNPADWLVDVLSHMVPGMEGVDLAAAWEARCSSSSSASPLPPLPSASTPLLLLQRPAPPRLGAQLLLQLRRALLFRLRDKFGLTVFSLLHAFMALALSTGFSILLQQSYLRTLYGPMLPAFLPFTPAFLRPHAAASNLDDLGLQQLMFFLSIACGTASGMSSIAVFGGLAGEFKREVDSGASAVALGLGRMLAEMLLTGWVAVSVWKGAA
jgi:ABC-type multidrug transport system ATPase subunit